MTIVTPAQAGVQPPTTIGPAWAPAFAGVTDMAGTGEAA